MSPRKKSPPAKPRKKGVRKPNPLARTGVLTWEQDRFVSEFLLDLNVGRAAERARLSPATGYKYFAVPHVRAEIVARLAARRQRAWVKEAYVLERLVMEIEYDGDESSQASRANAIDKLMRHLGMFSRDQLTLQGDAANPLRMEHSAGPILIDADSLPPELCQKLLEYRILGKQSQDNEIVDV